MGGSRLKGRATKLVSCRFGKNDETTTTFELIEEVGMNNAAPF